MRIEQTVQIPRGVADVWAFLGNVPAVVSCVPGAELGEQLGDNRYRGTFRLKIGPLSTKIEGEGEVLRDETAKTGRIIGRGIDKRGGSRVSASVNYVVIPDKGGTHIAVSAELELSGPLAQVGRTGIIEDVAKRLTEEFTAELKLRLDASGHTTQSRHDDSLLPDAPAPALITPAREFDAGSAVIRSLTQRIISFVRRLFSRNA